MALPLTSPPPPAQWRDPRGTARVWEAAERTERHGEEDGVAVLARVSSRGAPPAVVVISQFRPPMGGKVLELPAGLTDPGEGPAAVALRELREETGERGAGRGQGWRAEGGGGESGGARRGSASGSGWGSRALPPPGRGTLSPGSPTSHEPHRRLPPQGTAGGWWASLLPPPTTQAC